MADLNTNLTRLADARNNIAQAIVAKGGTVGTYDGFEDFPDDIGNIPEGSFIGNFDVVGDSSYVSMNNIHYTYIDNLLFIFGNYSLFSRVSITVVPNPLLSTKIILPSSFRIYNGYIDRWGHSSCSYTDVVMDSTEQISLSYFEGTFANLSGYTTVTYI